MDERIKVTDKRMFTAEGEYREEYRDQEVEENSTGDRPESKPIEEAPRVAQPRDEQRAPETVVPRVAAPDSLPDSPRESPLKSPGESRHHGPAAPEHDLPAPTFVDLIGLLAQPIPMFMGDAAMPGGEAEENLPLARFYIDLLDLVRSKTEGNINAEEARLLEDLLYQLRMRYVEKVE